MTLRIQILRKTKAEQISAYWPESPANVGHDYTMMSDENNVSLTTYQPSSADAKHWHEIKF